MPDFAKIRIQLPKGCNRKSLSIDALDERTRSLAFQTYIFIDGKQLLCTGFRLQDLLDGGEVLLLTVAPECFELVQAETPSDPHSAIHNSHPARLPGDKTRLL